MPMDILLHELYCTIHTICISGDVDRKIRLTIILCESRNIVYYILILFNIY